jgi:hypothetical protein
LQLLLHFGHDLKDVAFPLAPRLGYHPAEARAWKGELESEVRLGNAQGNIFDRRGEVAVLIERRVGGSLEDSEDHSMAPRLKADFYPHMTPWVDTDAEGRGEIGD